MAKVITKDQVKANKQKKGIITFEENKYFTYGLLSLFLVLVFFATTFKVGGDDDFFWHLATGRFIVENKYVPDKDIFGYVTQGVEWMPFEWGWDVISYGLYTLGGYNAVLVFRSIVFMFIFWLLYLTLRKFKVNSVVIVIVLFSLLVAIMDRLTPRPHILTYVFFVLLIHILVCYKYLDREKYGKWLYLLPVIFLLWGNIHMGVLAGGLVLFIFTVSEIIIFYYPRKFTTKEIKALTNDQLKKLFIISVISALVLLLNPHGLRTYLYAYGHTKMKLLETINEWKSPLDKFFAAGFVTNLYLIYLFSGIFILLYALKTKDLFIALLYTAFFIYSVRAIRFTVDFEIVMAFFITISLNYYILKLGYNKSKNHWVNYILYNNYAKVVISLFFIYLVYGIPQSLYEKLEYYRVFGYGIDDNYLAIQLMDFMKENNIKGRPFNHFGTGGTLVWYFPDQKNFLDSRNLNDDIFNEYQRIISMAPGFEKKLDDYKVDYVIYLDPDLIRRFQEVNRLIVNYLSNKHEWKLVFWDDKSFLFLRDEPQFSEIIKKYEYKILNPYFFYFSTNEFNKKAKENPEQVKLELSRKAQTEPRGFIYNNMNQDLIKVLPSIYK